jgi:hypothetical protein
MQFPCNPSFSQTLPGLQLAIDSTSLGAFKTCSKYYYYTIIHGYISRSTKIDLLFGLLYHASLEWFDHKIAEGMEYEEAIKSTVRRVLELTWDKEKNKPIEMDDANKNRPNLLRTVIWYLDKFKDDQIPTVILANGKPAVELSFRFELDFKSSTNEPYLMCGHLDRVVEWGNSKKILDRKTTRHTLDDKYYSQFSPHNQFSLYDFAGPIVFGVNTSGIVVDAAQIAVTFSRFERREISRVPAIREEWYKDLKYWLGQMDLCAQTQHWPQNDKACFMCEFKSVCSKPESLRKSFLDGQFDKRIWNPLQVRGDI